MPEHSYLEIKPESTPVQGPATGPKAQAQAQ